MRVLGIDPGSRFMGYGVVEERRGRLVHVGHGVIKVDPDDPLELRLKELHDSLLTALRLYKPQAVAVEGVFTFRNARSALILGHARGVALLAAAQVGLTVHEYPPARVKRAVGAGGAAGKDAVARMVCTFLNSRRSSAPTPAMRSRWPCATSTMAGPPCRWRRARSRSRAASRRSHSSRTG